MTTTAKNTRPIEVWHQDNHSQDLWHGNNGVIVNTAALEERETYFDIIRIPSASFIPLEDLINSIPLN